MTQAPTPPPHPGRYIRQTVLPEISDAGQERLRNSRVLIVGAGGLGSPAAMYLTAAGVGRIGIVDPDNVDLTNLQRQILHPERNLGIPKTESAAQTLKAMNPSIDISLHPVALDDENADSLLAPYDIALGCLDNFPTRYALNRACMRQNKPNVFASVSRFEGQASVFAPPGPCYRCFFREPPAPQRQIMPEDNGILGPVAGILGCIQAVETIKMLLHIGKPLLSRLLLVNALRMSFREIPLSVNPDCPDCASRQR